VVISIIALLVAILLPALQKARAQAKYVLCLTNLHQIGLAAFMYMDDNDDFIPHGVIGSQGNYYEVFIPYLALEGVVLQDQVNPGLDGSYTENGMDIYRCPSHPDKRCKVTYVVNDWSYDGAGNSNRPGDDYYGKPSKYSAYRHLNDVVYLADGEDGPWRQCVEFFEGGDNWMDLYAPSHLPSSENISGMSGRRVANNRHHGGLNVLYYDLRADWLSGNLEEFEYVRMWRSR